MFVLLSAILECTVLAFCEVVSNMFWLSGSSALLQ